MPKMTTEQYREKAAEKVAAAQEVLASEIASLVTGEDWRRFLDFQAKLHDYSPNNVMLIFAQHAQAFEAGRVDAPTPSYVAGFRTWQALGRNVERGQHGYAVLAPMRGVRREATDTEGNVRVLRRDETPCPDEAERKTAVLRGFTVEHVFDASQTSGEPLPVAPHPQLLEGEAPRGLGLAVMEMIEAKGYRVDTVPDAVHIGGANGQTHWVAKTVVVRADMDDAAMVKSLIHEAAHVLLHEGPPGRYLPRPTKEVEAESVAYVVAAVHGMSTDGYSFPYVAAWAGEDADKAIRETQARVARAAKAIIAVSPADQDSGGKAPGADLVVSAARQLDQHPAERRAQAQAQMAGLTEAATAVRYDGPEVA